MPQLIVEHIGKEYPTRSDPLVVLRDISLELSAGENLAVLGPSGSGKSTLLHILGTLDTPSSGTIRLENQDPFLLREGELADFRNRNIGFIFQDHHLLPQLTVLENVLVPALAARSADEAALNRARELIERVGLSKRIDHRPAELSGGERQRVAVARALIYSPMLLLADEPTGSLDRTNAVSIGRLLLELQAQENSILVVVTHSLELSNMLTRRLELDNGELKNKE